MERQPVIVHNLSAHKGMGDKVEPWYLGEHQAAFLQNLDPSRIGARKRRLGASSVGGRTDTPHGVWRVDDHALGQEVLHAAYGGSLYRLNGSGSIDQIACGVSLTGTLHMSVEGRWTAPKQGTYVGSAHPDDSNITLASKLVVISGHGEYTQCSNMAPICMTWFQHRLWCAGNVLAENSQTLWWSALEDGLSYSLTNTIMVEPGVGGRITGLVGIRGDVPTLLIFKERALCYFQPRWGSSSAFIPGAADALDTIESRVELLSANTGCVAARSIQHIPGSGIGDVIFLAPDGFRSIRLTELNALEGASPPLSDTIKDTIARINFTYAHKAASIVVDMFYHCAVPLDGATSNTHVITFDLLNGGWYLNSWAGRDLAAAHLVESADRLFLQYASSTADCGATGAFTGYHVFKGFSGQLDPGGAAVVFQEDTRGMLPTGNILDKQRWDRVGIVVRNEATSTCNLTVLYNIDQGGWVTAGSLSFAGNAATVVLGQTPLPWESALAKISARYLSLSDAVPGYEIQIRYISEDTYSVPSVLDVALIATPIGPEFDNSI